MSLKCNLGIHAWMGCKCTVCGKIRNEGHDWRDDCKVCSCCGTERMAAHSWSWSDGKCLVCGQLDRRTSSQLLRAAGIGNLGTVEALVAEGIGVDARGDQNDTPLHMAAANSRTSVVEWLLTKGADYEAKNELGFRPLHNAAASGALAAIECLLGAGADIESRAVTGWTPLHFAVIGGRLDAVKLLVAKGVDCSARDNLKQTAADLALAELKKFNFREGILQSNMLETVKSYGDLRAVADYLGSIAGATAMNGREGQAQATSRREGNDQPSIRVFDARSDQQRANERDGIAGENIPPEAAELYEALVQAHAWGGAQERWPSHDEYPQRQRVRDLGERIDKAGGLDAMQRAAYYINSRNGDLTSHLDQFWHGIGSWLA